MREPRPPADEAARLEALARYHVMDTGAEPAFDEIVELAAHICDVPVSLVSLVDKDRQWFKARVGIDAQETPRGPSFCGHVVETGDPLVVDDATRDERFFDNPLVTGDPHVVFYAGSPLRTEDGHTLGTLCVIDHEPRELTAAQLEMLGRLSRVVVRHLELRLEIERRRETEQALRAAKEMAQSANAAKSAFLTHTSHELRTPLNSIIGFTKLLSKNPRGAMTDKEVLYLDRVHANGTHLLALINDLLDLTKIEAGHADLTLEEVALEEAIEAVTAQVAGAVADSGNEIVSSAPSGLAPLRADPRRLRQILINLVGNANKFTSKGRIEVRVQVDPAAPDRAARVDIVDDGVGIPRDKLELIFDPFRQVSEGEARAFDGSGLGLAISRSLAALHGFSIAVDSVVGVGTTFSLMLCGDAPAPKHVGPCAREPSQP